MCTVVLTPELGFSLPDNAVGLSWTPHSKPAQSLTMYEPLGETNHTINTGVTNKCEDRTSKLKVTALVLILGFAIGTFVFAYKSYQVGIRP